MLFNHSFACPCSITLSLSIIPLMHSPFPHRCHFSASAVADVTAATAPAGVWAPPPMLAHALRFCLEASSGVWLAPLQALLQRRLEECRHLTLRPSSPTLSAAIAQVVDAVVDLFQVFCDCLREFCPSCAFPRITASVFPCVFPPAHTFPPPHTPSLMY